MWGWGGVLRKRRTRHTLPRLAAAEDRHRGGDWRGVRTGRSEAFPWRVSRHRSVELVERDSRVLRQRRELRAAVAAADVLAPASGPQTLVPTGRRGQGRWRLHTAASQEGGPEPREPRSGKTGRKRFGLRPEGPVSFGPKAAGRADVVGGTVGTRAVQLCWRDVQATATRGAPPAGDGPPASRARSRRLEGCGQPQGPVLPGVRLSGP